MPRILLRDVLVSDWKRLTAGKTSEIASQPSRDVQQSTGQREFFASVHAVDSRKPPRRRPAHMYESTWYGVVHLEFAAMLGIVDRFLVTVW